MRFQRPSELSKGEVRLTEADRQSVPQTWSGNTKRTIADARDVIIIIIETFVTRLLQLKNEHKRYICYIKIYKNR